MDRAADADVDVRALHGVVSKAVAALTSRTIAYELVVLGGTVTLTRLLGPRDFGVFAIVQYALELLVLFGDTGLAGALVRQREEPTEQQLSTAFYFQLAASGILMAAVVALSPLLPRVWPDLPASAPVLLRVVALNFVIVCVRIPPLLLMERRFQFAKMAVVDVGASATFFGVAISLAAMGFGVWSLACGVLMQGLFATVAVFALSHWRPRAVFEWRALRPLLRFGVAQQIRNLFALVNDSVTPIFGGRMLGSTAVGYMNWSRSTAYFPLKVVQILARVGFPLFARLQHDRALLGESLGRMIQVSAFATFAWVGLCLGLGEQFTAAVFSATWLPAVPILMVFAAAIAIGFLSPLVAVALDAMGRPGLFTRIAIGWTAITWLVAPIATLRWGIIGLAAGYCSHVVVGNIVVAVVMRRILPETKFWLRVRAPVAGSAAVIAVGRLVLAPYVNGLITFGLAAIVLTVVYVGVVWLIDGRTLVRALTVVPGVVDADAKLERAV
ncbi:MAG TPA: oligosaccharide flippase family protein [Vicinamibacterales bacterium]|nr:oligosaccharide flippase family protein [Vicinamibacterales bacterium]